jgi:anti-sigma-K factor RskA
VAVNHEEWLERADVYALGALDHEELVRFEAHLAAGCARCEARLLEMREALTALPRALPPLDPPPAARARLLDAVATERQEVAAPPAIRRRGGFRAWAGVAGGLVAAGVLVGLGLELSRTRDELGQLRARVAGLQGEVTRQQETLAFLSDPQVRYVSLAGLPASPGASGWLLWNPGTRSGLLLARGLPPAPPGRAYELWALAGAEPVPAGVFTVDAAGRALLRLPALPAARTFDKFAVTLEPAAGVPLPTGPMHLLGSL